MPTGAEEAAAVKAVVSVVQIAEEQGWLDKLKNVFRTKHKVIILGSTGTGKSNFIDSLQKLIPAAINHMTRTEFAEQERVHLGGKIFDFTDTPGQDAHRDRRLEAVRKILDQKSFGVINVVCWGYHEYKTGKSEAVGANARPTPAWLEDHRKVELLALTDWVPLMAARPAYTITLVTKADLWWPERDAAVKYYESGPYYHAIRDAAIHGHSVVPYSSVFHRFYDVAKMPGTFETKDREECQERFLETLFTSVAKR